MAAPSFSCEVSFGEGVLDKAMAMVRPSLAAGFALDGVEMVPVSVPIWTFAETQAAQTSSR